jgi:outer membrane protein assembly factor BamB
MKAPVVDAIPIHVGFDLWVAGGIVNGISLVDTTTEALLLDAGMPLGPIPNGLEIRGDEAFVLGSGDATLRVFDVPTLAPVRSFDLSAAVTDPWDLAFASDEKAYVSGLVSDNVIAIDPRTGDVLANVALPPVADIGATPAGIEIGDGKVFVACNHVADDFSAYGDGLVYVIDAASDTPIDVDGNPENGVTPIVTTQKNVTDLAFGASGDLYAVCTGDWSFAPGSFSRVDVIDVDTYAVTGSIDIGDFTKANTASAAPNGKIYLGDALGPSLFSIDGNAGTLLRGAADPIVVPHGDGYSSSSKLRFRDGVAWGVEFNSDTLFAFSLSADEDAGAVTFSTSLDLTPGETWIGAQFLAFVPPPDAEDGQ